MPRGRHSPRRTPPSSLWSLRASGLTPLAPSALSPWAQHWSLDLDWKAATGPASTLPGAAAASFWEKVQERGEGWVPRGIGTVPGTTCPSARPSPPPRVPPCPSACPSAPAVCPPLPLEVRVLQGLVGSDSLVGIIGHHGVQEGEALRGQTGGQ